MKMGIVYFQNRDVEDAYKKSLRGQRLCGVVLQWLGRPAVVAALIFLLAVVPRTVSLGAFLAVDENDTWAWSNAFIRAVTQGDWPGTVVGDGYPGITAFWLQGVGVAVRGLAGAVTGRAMGLDALLGDPERDALSLIAARRMPIAMANAFLVAACYLLARRLLGDKAAALGAFLLAWDPFYIADGRLMRSDALLAGTMTLSMLALLAFVGEGRWRWLILSGATAGLAMLTKSTAVFLGPFCALVLIAQGKARGLLWHALRAFLLWSVAAMATYVILWPGVWSAPAEAAGLVIGKAALSAGTPHELGSFFLGQPCDDPGPLFYPVAFAMRATPVDLLGLLLAALSLAGLFRTSTWQAGARRGAGWLLAYCLLFVAYLTLGTKKQDRYLLPIFPAVYLLAALGFHGLKGLWSKAGHGLLLPRVLAGVIGLGLLALAQGATTFPHHPYYLTYYNPLLGGGREAVRLLPVGSGEGLDLAARYLDSKAEAPALRVASWYRWQFAPFFHGETSQLYQVEPALSADYAVFYVNQVQRQRPDPALVRYFESRTPEQVIRLHGFDYAWIYRGPIYGYKAPPGVQHQAGLDFGSQARLLGYDLEQATTDPTHPAHITLYWQALAEMKEDYNVYLRVADERGVIWGQVDRMPVSGLWGTSRWQAGMYVTDEYDLPVEPGTPPGSYALEVGMYSFHTGQPLPVRDANGQPLARAVIGNLAVVKPRPFPAPESLVMGHHSAADLADSVRLLGYDFTTPEHLQPGDRLSLVLYWQARQAVNTDYLVAVRLLDQGGALKKEWRSRPAGGRYGTVGWEAEEIVRDPWKLTVPASLASGTYELSVSLVDGATGGLVGNSLSLGRVEVQGRARNFSVPPIGHPLTASLGGQAELLGYDVEPELLRPGGLLRLTLYWRALSEMETSYTVFVHLLDDRNRIIGQRDSIPGNGALPTTGWATGEVITDTYEVPIPGNVPAGKYLLEVGMYDAATGKRLDVSGPGQEGDRVILTYLRVQE
jgi:4-amino-4-deoxy-L-arabinose transferase-like glycosyltransferase